MFIPFNPPNIPGSFVKGATKDVAGQRKSHLNAGIYQLCAVAATEARLRESCDNYLRKLLPYTAEMEWWSISKNPLSKTQPFWG